jgi:hypothetical protein
VKLGRALARRSQRRRIVPSTVRKKKDGGDPNKKRRRMRADEARRHVHAGRVRPSHDRTDKILYTRGSSSDRTRAGAT